MKSAALDGDSDGRRRESSSASSAGDGRPPFAVDLVVGAVLPGGIVLAGGTVLARGTVLAGGTGSLDDEVFAGPPSDASTEEADSSSGRESDPDTTGSTIMPTA